MVDQIRVRGGVLLGALVAGGLTAGTLTGAPTANATCASFFGIGNSADCSSNLTSVAIAIGTGAQAHADGLFGAVFSDGNAADARTYGAFTFATAVGDHASAVAGYLFGIAAQRGPNSEASVSGFANIAINVSPVNTNPGGPAADFALASGFGNFAINLFGNATGSLLNRITADGIVNVAANFGGNNSLVHAGGPNGLNVGNVAVNAFGYGTTLLSHEVVAFGVANVATDLGGVNNKVSAGNGPLAIAGSIGQNGATVTKKGPGFNINGVVVGGAAAVGSPKTAIPAAAHSRTPKTAPAAAATGRGKR